MQIFKVILLFLVMMAEAINTSRRKKENLNALDSRTSRKKTKIETAHKNRNRSKKPYRGCSFEPDGKKTREKKALSKVCNPFWKIRPYDCQKNGHNRPKSNATGKKPKCHKFEWKVVNDKTYKDKIDQGAKPGNYLLLKASQTNNKQESAVFETKIFRRSRKNKCLKFKHSMYCNKNCAPYPNGVMSLQVKLVYGKRNQDNHQNSVKIWERIDAKYKKGQWMDSVQITLESLQENRKNTRKHRGFASRSNLKVVFEAKRGDAKDAMVAIDDVRLVRCSRRPKAEPPTTETPLLSEKTDCQGGSCPPQIIPLPLEARALEALGAQVPHSYSSGEYKAAQVPGAMEMVMSETTNVESLFEDALISPDISYDTDYESPMFYQDLVCTYTDYAININKCIANFNAPSTNGCRADFDALTACFEDVAYLCARLNDDEDLAHGKLESNIKSFIKDELDLYESYCGDPNEFPVYNLTAHEPECPPDFSSNLERCMRDFTAKYYILQSNPSTSVVCNEWEKNVECKRAEISKCNFKSNLNMLISGIGNAVQDNHVRSTFCGK